MRSIRTEPEVEDRTTQAKIRDAAIARFPVDGLNGTTVRAIAKDAGVSPALVIHHFGSKDGLHRACDEHVVRLMMEMKAESIKDGTYRQSSATAAATPHPIRDRATDRVIFSHWAMAPPTDAPTTTEAPAAARASA